jgi:hypothetical protein
VGTGVDSTTGAAATGAGDDGRIASTGCGDAAGCSDCSTTIAVTHASTPAPPTRASDHDFF